MSAKPESESRPSEKAPGQIITFYSYKGGTGRTMLLANVAFILASHGKRVLVVDWDLEAPGLHRYFRPFLADPDLTSSPGVIDMVTDYAIEAMTEVAPEAEGEFESANILRFASSLRFPFPKPGTIDMVPAGRQGPSYAAHVNSFNWQNFYDRLGGGSFLEAIKRGMREEYDYILIDSRTGVSDTSGICTVQLPDALVVCFTLNDQSIEGASAIAASVKAQRPEAEFRVFPVPTRVEEGEKKKLEAARDLARAKFAEFVTYVNPERRDEYWGDVEVPYKIFYAYEEVLAIFGDRPQQPTSMLAAAERLTGHVTRGEVSRLAPMSEEERTRWLAEFERGRKSRAARGLDAGKPATPFSETKNESKAAPPQPSPMPGKHWLLVGSAALLTIVTAIVGVALSPLSVGNGGGDRDAGVKNPGDAGLSSVPSTSGDSIVAAVRATQDPLLRALLLAELPVDVEPEEARAMIEEVAKRPLPIAVLRGSKRQILGAYFSGDGGHVVSATSDGVWIWPSDGRGESRTIRLEIDKAPITNPNITDFDVAGDVVTAGTSDGYYGIWSVSEDVEPFHLRKMATGHKSIRLSPDGTAWLRATSNKVYLRSISKTQGALIADEPTRKEMEVAAPILSADIGESLIVTVESTRIDVWGRSSFGITEMPLTTRMLGNLWSDKSATTVQAVFAHDLHSFALAADTGEVVAFRTKSNLSKEVLRTTVAGLGAIAVGGEYCVTSALGAVQLWNWKTRDVPRRAGIHKAAVQSIAFSATVHSFVSASDDGTAKVFLIQRDGTALEQWELRGNGAPLLGASFSPDERRVVTVANDGTIWVWQLTSGIPLEGSWTDLLLALRKATSACISITDRTTLLKEPPEVAASRFIACEKSNGRSGDLRGN